MIYLFDLIFNNCDVNNNRDKCEIFSDKYNDVINEMHDKI